MLHSLPVEQYPSRKYIHANVERTDCCLSQRGCHSDGVPTRLGNRIFMAYGNKRQLLPDAVLKANLQRLKQMLAADEELAGYADMFLWKNSEKLFK